MSGDTPSYYAVIPASIRYDKRIPPNAKLLYGEITALCNKEGYCWAGNSYFAGLYEKNERSVINWINALRQAGYITVSFTYTAGTKEIERRIIRLSDGNDAQVVKKSSGGGEKNFTTPGKNFQKVVKISSEGSEKNFTDNITKTTTKTTTTTTADSPPEPEAGVEEVSLAKKEESLKKALAEIDEELVFDPEFYGKACKHLASSSLDERYLLWLYKQCLKRDPKSLAGLYYKLFFAPNQAELFKVKHKSKPPPPAQIIQCPVCGKEHNLDDEVCPKCYFERERLDDNVRIETACKIYHLPLDKKKVFQEEILAVFKRKDNIFAGIHDIYKKYKLS